MKKLLFTIILFTFFDCNVQNELYKQFHTPKGRDKYIFEVPKKYVSENKIGSGEKYYAQDYLYSDSSLFYVTTFPNTENYEEIREQNTYYKRFSAFHTGDTITIEGIDEKGLYWKDRLLKGGITIGYSRVSIKNKSTFDKSILSIRKLE